MNNEISYYNFIEFIFVGDDSSDEDIKDIITINNILFKKDSLFNGSIFMDTVEMHNLKFEKGANFRGSIFRDKVRMQELYFWGVDFQHVRFENDVAFESVDFMNSYTLFSDTQFDSSVFFKNSKFDGILDFSDSHFNKNKLLNSYASFSDISFEDSVIFTNSVFDCTVEFKNIVFASDIEFMDTQFNPSKSTNRLRHSTVAFLDIDVRKNAVLIFESTDPQKKMFSQEVQFSFKNAIEGQIKFQNVNFNHIVDTVRDELIALARIGKVEIGSGCIKYRHQTEIKTLIIDQDNQALALEITQTFVNYFTARNGLNLGFEVVSRDSQTVCFFYFTDENITKADFLERLEYAEKDLWSLLSLKPDSQLLLPSESGQQALPESTNESRIINTIDGLSALASTFFRVSVRIGLGRWKERDTQMLVNSIHTSHNQIPIDPIVLHQTINNYYHQKALFSINSQQSITSG